MLHPDDIRQLIEAAHPDPCAVLGPHRRAADWQVTVLLPGAAAVQLVDATHGAALLRLDCLDPAGLWSGTVPGAARPDYRLAVRWQDGHCGLYADAYAYGTLLSEADLQALRAGQHPHPYELLGAHPLELGGIEGVRFAVWAPNARRVSVVGAFNGWDGRRHPMRRRHLAGVWELFVPHVRRGDLYKYEILDCHGQLQPLKSDPFGFAAELRPGSASRVHGLPAPRALPPARAAANRRDAPISIYEVHLPSWRQLNPDGFPTWEQLAAELPAYAAGLGFTHLELLPISEHPYDASWGYQPTGMYAVSARFGDPDGLAHFVAACHQHGLGVILDWVPAHFPSDAHGLARFDGTALYEYADPREGFHLDWNTLIYNFGRHEVRNFLSGSAVYWIKHQGVDGLRVDAVASMLYRDYSRPAGHWVPNHLGGRENLEAIALLQAINTQIGAELPGAITLAEESTAFPGVSAPTSAGGLGFHYKWNMGWMNDTLRYVATDPIHRRWHHDLMSFGLVYGFSENFVLPISHDEVVHGKGSMLGKMPGDDWQRFATLRAYYGFMWGHPGKKLLFMGQEFAQRGEWDHRRPLPWDELADPRHEGVQRLIGDLNRLYRRQPALHRLDCVPAGFRWLVVDDREQSVYAWARLDDAGGVVIVVCNFTPIPRPDYLIPLPPGPMHWREALNTDSRHYGGADLGNHGAVLHAEGEAAAPRLRMQLPPLATVFLVPA
ncbi:MAG: 1,4-alpha-glucan branching protein GlgB [Xanthomonadales bacterium]|jgi:1,4-alpha-glucan branching enzyme|nr:1,4-alpha-glucan branching protein GlgB [Xanthomonadales bacterium]